jgi:sugar-specific transcriptional regulator TrmB
MTDEIRDLIEERLVELEDEAGKLSRALDQLTPTRGRGRSASSGNTSAVSSRRPRRKRAAPGERQRQLIEAIGKMPGATANELAHALDLGPTQIYGLVRSLEKKKAIRKKGQGFEVLA